MGRRASRVNTVAGHPGLERRALGGGGSGVERVQF